MFHTLLAAAAGPRSLVRAGEAGGADTLHKATRLGGSGGEGQGCRAENCGPPGVSQGCCSEPWGGGRVGPWLMGAEGHLGVSPAPNVRPAL